MLGCFLNMLAEREGFEPSIRFPVFQFSRLAPSTTRPPLRLLQFYYSRQFFRRYTPVEVPEALFAKLREKFAEAQLVELSATLAWENYRARFDHAFGVEAEGFSEESYCALPAFTPTIGL
jgi:hypothetical protein